MADATLNALLDALPPLPCDRARIDVVAVRPALDQRAFPAVLELCPERGAVGDRWIHRTWRYLEDGRPDPGVQVALANTRLIHALQAFSGNPHHPGDTLLADLDLSMTNLPVGARLRAGTALLEVSSVVNDGCTKFAAAYGAAALAWVRQPGFETVRRRGCFCRVVEAGCIRAGDWLIRAD